MQNINYPTRIPDSKNSPIGNEPSSGNLKVYYDATLILHFGFTSAVGIIRVEHYITRHLTQYSNLDIEYVTFCTNTNQYRCITNDEHESINNILFQKPDTKAKPDIKIPYDQPVQNNTRTKLYRSNQLHKDNAEDFKLSLYKFILFYLPIKKEQSILKRIMVRILRITFRKLAILYFFIFKNPLLIGSLFSKIFYKLIKPDASFDDVIEPTQGFTSTFKNPLSQKLAFQPGAVLLCFGNGWDYLNYTYLSNLVEEKKLRFISIIYDVIGVELPFVTPELAHNYHRHWVEIGHIAERLVAISRFSADSYQHFIGRPNHIDLPLHYSLLPNFLRHDVQEQQTEVQELYDKKFILYCSTIEIRKNHILLLNLWEELRQLIEPKKLPLLIFVGKWGWHTDLIRLIIERNWRIRSHVLVLNEVSDGQLIWLYKNAQFTVFPSLSEGFGLAATESLSFGTPVITSNCPALKEATENLMPSYHPHDFIGWKEELEKLIVDADYLESLRELASTFQGSPYTAFASLVYETIIDPSNLIPHASNRGPQ